MRIVISLLAAAAAISAGACSGETSDGAGQATKSACGDGGIVVSDAWMRAARKGQPTTAAYLSLCNGGADDRLVSVSFPDAAAELHVTSISEDGTASMAPAADGIPLPAGERVELKPEGTHIMVIGAAEAVAEGDAPIVTLEFENAPPIGVVLEVRDAAHYSDHSNHGGR